MKCRDILWADQPLAKRLGFQAGLPASRFKIKNRTENFTHIPELHLRRHRVFDELDATHFQGLVVFVAGVIFFIDGYDIFGDHNPYAFACLLAWSDALGNRDCYARCLPPPVRTIIGQYALGVLADLYGRRKMYGLELLVIIITTVGVTMASEGASQSMNLAGWLIFWRFLMGIGIGADYPLSAVIVSEFVPTKSRARMIATVFVMQQLSLSPPDRYTMEVLNRPDEALEDLNEMGWKRATRSPHPQHWWHFLKPNTAQGTANNSGNNNHSKAPKITEHRVSGESSRDARNRSILSPNAPTLLSEASSIITVDGPARRSIKNYDNSDIDEEKPSRPNSYKVISEIFNEKPLKFTRDPGGSPLSLPTRSVYTDLLENLYSSKLAAIFTTFMVPAKLFPTRFRCTAHGISSAAGKIASVVVQAFVAFAPIGSYRSSDPGAEWLGYVIIIFVPFMLLGVAVTKWLIPETRESDGSNTLLEQLEDVIKMNRQVKFSCASARRGVSGLVLSLLTAFVSSDLEKIFPLDTV
ncbi:inorganic phosphate transporter [Blastomyces dermatitidis ER-3]|uniref:Inorganic phosphate transporter n=1 Tax=Ajellomyces dermatitidis (strain ER-3 / ATCC MYA-2586) TaxID=559297 RepID=A0ABP2F6U0_AJEDR|nr:inorganic phosphate transporter [Blastomyces dermatitidis ER-3]EEQ91421.2 inorganic phosphate transporter [Blastomyces dermatitidis ER-3]